MSRVIVSPGGGLRVHLHAADWVANFFQGSQLRLRDDLKASIISNPKLPAAIEEAQTTMEDLNSYLNDHLAGSVGALELLDRLIRIYKDKPLEQFFLELRGEIEADQETLKRLIANLDQEESTVRKAGAWVMEKLSRAKIQPGEEKGELGLFLALEGLVLGITGKRALWRALAAASATLPQLRSLNYDDLEKRAVDQHGRVEAKRLEIAREVFTSG